MKTGMKEAAIRRVPAEELINAARDADMIVVGSRGAQADSPGC
jgi:nucleotide-binding universal stress UspA family protein